MRWLLGPGERTGGSQRMAAGAAGMLGRGADHCDNIIKPPMLRGEKLTGDTGYIIVALIPEHKTTEDTAAGRATA